MSVKFDKVKTILEKQILKSISGFFVCVKLLRTTDYLIQHLHQNIAFAYYLVQEQKTPSDDHMSEEVQYGQIRGVHFILFRYCYLSLNGNPTT